MARGWKLSMDDVKETIKRYRKGESLATIGKHFQVSRQAIHHHLVQVGVIRRTIKAAHQLRAKKLLSEKRALKRST